MNGKIIVFANQKGGVGKSTLTILYANHLTKEELNKSVLVVEFDIQKSISLQRKREMAAMKKSLIDEDDDIDESVKYNVEYVMLKGYEESVKLMEGFKKQQEATILIDLPGNITDDYIAPVLILSDFIICPYQYENKVLESTTTFIKVLASLRKKFPELMLSKTVFVPNRIDIRKGTAKDFENQEKVDSILKAYGEVVPKIPDRVDFERMNTIGNTLKQEQFCEKCFDQLDRLIFGLNNNKI